MKSMVFLYKKTKLFQWNNIMPWGSGFYHKPETMDELAAIDGRAQCWMALASKITPFPAGKACDFTERVFGALFRQSGKESWRAFCFVTLLIIDLLYNDFALLAFYETPIM